ncbi:MAG: hypothetical protein QW038_02980 [Nanopusillaceae archaeon]
MLNIIERKLTEKEIENYDKIVKDVVFESLIRAIKDKLKIGFYYNKKEVDVCFNNFDI